MIDLYSLIIRRPPWIVSPLTCFGVPANNPLGTSRDPRSSVASGICLQYRTRGFVLMQMTNEYDRNSQFNATDKLKGARFIYIALREQATQKVSLIAAYQRIGSGVLFRWSVTQMYGILMLTDGLWFSCNALKDGWVNECIRPKIQFNYVHSFYIIHC